MTGTSAAAEVRALVARPGPRDVRARAAAESIRRSGGYRWVGVYDVLEAEISALAWTGCEAPAHPTFRRQRGLCGAAAASGQTVVVGDVRADPRYLTTFGTTRSEIVVPVRAAGGEVAGLLDVESEREHAFGAEDRGLLGACAAALAPLWRADDRAGPRTG